jgi:hypothetical protein
MVYLISFVCVCKNILLFFFGSYCSFYSPQLSEEENMQVYGKCNNINGHGHNYVGEFITVNLHTVFFNKINIKQSN